MAIKPIQQGKILTNSYHYNATASGGNVVEIDSSTATKTAKVYASGGNALGLLGQEVVAATTEEWKLDSVTRRARVSGLVGIYYDGGTYLLDSDSYSGNVPADVKLYPNASGYLCSSNALDAGMGAVAISLTSGNAASGNEIEIKLLV